METQKRKSRYRVIVVTLKQTILDPQGMTIQRTIAPHGFGKVADVRQGKYFQVYLQSGLPAEEEDAILERLGKEVLTNPVTEQFVVVPRRRGLC